MLELFEPATQHTFAIGDMRETVVCDVINLTDACLRTATFRTIVDGATECEAATRKIFGTRPVILHDCTCTRTQVVTGSRVVYAPCADSSAGKRIFEPHHRFAAASSNCSRSIPIPKKMKKT
eukprot:148781-Prymnesium_polylepis.1